MPTAVVDASVMAPTAAAAAAPVGSITVTGARTYRHAQTDHGICAGQELGGALTKLDFLYVSSRVKAWDLEVILPKIERVSNVDLSKATDVQVYALQSATHTGGPQGTWGSGEDTGLLQFGGHGTGHLSAAQGDLSGTVTAAMKPSTLYKPSDATGTIHVTASWHCSRISFNGR
jgi:hypothetical protein